MTRRIAFALGITIGALAYPLGLALGEEIGRRHGSGTYAFGAK